MSSRWTSIVPYVLLLVTLVVFPRGVFNRQTDRA
jgi:branched-subunit amino acid ABC-type transport system permease component